MGASAIFRRSEKIESDPVCTADRCCDGYSLFHHLLTRQIEPGSCCFHQIDHTLIGKHRQIMRRQTILIAGLALIAGIAAAIGVRRLARQWEPQPVEPTVAVVTMADDVARGDRIPATALTVSRWPQSRVPADAVLDRDSTIGRVALVPLISGQPVFQSFLAPVNAVPGLASLVPEGMRAFTIRTPTIASGVAGFVLPGNRVDVLLTVGAVPFLAPGTVTVTLLQSVEIMAVDQSLDAENMPPSRTKQLKSVTLLVTPEQAAKLSLAQNGGTLELSLRNPADHQPATTVPITVADLRLRGELPNPDQADREKEKQELLGVLQRSMDQKVRDLQKSLESTTKLLKEATAAKTAPRPVGKTVRPEVRIRTLRGTYGGLVLVRPAENPTPEAPGEP
jgi:pilus assembly protein CpaB